MALNACNFNGLKVKLNIYIMNFISIMNIIIKFIVNVKIEGTEYC